MTPFAVVNDRDGRVGMILDADLMEHERVNFHPLVNTMTTGVSREDLVRFLARDRPRARGSCACRSRPAENCQNAPAASHLRPDDSLKPPRGPPCSPRPPPPQPDDLDQGHHDPAFRQDVIAESMKQPVLVDFWAPWCGPCKQLTPVLEKAVKAAGGKVKLVKMNIDEHPQIAGQLGIQSIPAVFAFQRGQPVDGFMGALPESQVKGFIERLVGPLGPSAAEDLLAEADALAAEGDAAGAAELYAAVLAQDPENVAAARGPRQAPCRPRRPRGRAGASSPWRRPAKANDPAVAGARAAIELAEQAASLGDLADLQRRVEADPARPPGPLRPRGRPQRPRPARGSGRPPP